MFLAIDVGNTNTVFALCRDEEILASWRLQTSAGKTGDEYGVFLMQAMQNFGFKDDISSVIISSVVSQVNFHMRQFCSVFLKCSPVFVDTENCDVTVDLPMPDEVGADRLVNARAVLHHYSAPAIVLDFGTATTFDVIGSNGTYQGGVIAPGINLSMDALAQAASRLPRVSVKKPERAIGKTTTQAMQSGIYWGYVGLIDGLISRLKSELDAAPVIIGTGGLSQIFANDIQEELVIDQSLTLKGLIAIHNLMAT